MPERESQEVFEKISDFPTSLCRSRRNASVRRIRSRSAPPLQDVGADAPASGRTVPFCLDVAERCGGHAVFGMRGPILPRRRPAAACGCTGFGMCGLHRNSRYAAAAAFRPDDSPPLMRPSRDSRRSRFSRGDVVITVCRRDRRHKPLRFPK